MISLRFYTATVCNVISHCPLRDWRLSCTALVAGSLLPVRIQDDYMGNTERWTMLRLQKRKHNPLAVKLDLCGISSRGTSSGIKLVGL